MSEGVQISYKQEVDGSIPSPPTIELAICSDAAKKSEKEGEKAGSLPRRAASVTSRNGFGVQFTTS